MLFFVISGFVVSRSLDRNRWLAREFMVKRFFRLVPALAVFIAAASASLYFFSGVNGWPFGHVKGSTIAVNALIGLIGGQAVTLLADRQPPVVMEHLWSLSVEDIFYASISIGVVTAAAFGYHRRKQRIGRYCLVIAGAVFVLRIASTGAAAYGATPPLDFVRRFSGAGYYVLEFLVNWRVEFLLLGVSLYCLLRAGGGYRGARWFALACLLTPFAVELLRHGQGSSSDEYYHLLTIPVALAGFSALLWLVGKRGVCLPMPSLLRTALEWMGDRSYTIYLFHLLLICFVWVLTIQMHAALAFTEPLFDFIIFGVSVLGTPAIAAPIYNWVERPLTAFGRRLVTRMANASAKHELSQVEVSG
jgi:peptidoglycan/LPS O-acetylase OafA/YrhL